MRYFYLLIFFGLICLSGLAQVPDNNPGTGIINADSGIMHFELRVYPNPVKNERVTVEIFDDEIIEIRLINIAGKEVINKKISSGTTKSQLVLYEIPNGIYFIRVKTETSKTFVKKLIVSSP